jgi:hypothetical protein
MTPQRRRGSGCGGFLATLVVMALVISGVVWVSPALDLGNVRDTVLTHDGLDGVPGSGGEGYTFLSTTSSGAPVTWPCEARIEVVLNPDGAPEGYAELVASALATVNGATSFDLVLTGETEDRGFLERGRGPVLLGWADEEEVPQLAGPTAGIGGATYLTGPGGTGTAVGGMVVIDRELPRGWFVGVDEESVVVHELLHVLGLGHTDQPGQLMAAETSGQTGLGDGDLAGLAALEETACA